MGITVGIVGVGSFGGCFVPIYRKHPEVDHIVLCDLKPDLLEQRSKEFDLPDTEPSLEQLLARKDVDAVAIHTQHWMHAEQAIQAMEAGKHVTTAVPAAYSIDQCRRLVETVQKNRRVYSVQETSVYYPAVAFARQENAQGKFGRIFYSEARYFHDVSHGLEEVWRRRYGEDWMEKAGNPPMMYVTHSTSALLAVTGAHALEVACLGFGQDGDPIYDPKRQHGNAFSNQVALLKMSDGTMARVGEFRRIGHAGEMAVNFFGTEASLQCDPYQWCDKQGSRPLDLSRLHSPLPDELVKFVFGGHQGSHPYLVHDFVSAVVNGAIPEVNVWAAVRHNLPGLVAVESAKQGGTWRPVPDFGDPPAAVGVKTGGDNVDDGWYQTH